MGKPEVVKPGQKEIGMTDERQLTMTKQGVRDAMKFSIPCTRRAETNGGKARGARA